MSRARISPFSAPPASPSSPSPSSPSSSSPASPSHPVVLPRLERVLGTLDELLQWLHMARQSGENLTNSPVFGRELEQAANELSEVCDDLKGAGHE
ncbi:hypothetical protein AB9L11_00925 [Desulfovibrio piger]